MMVNDCTGENNDVDKKGMSQVTLDECQKHEPEFNPEVGRQRVPETLRCQIIRCSIIFRENAWD